MEIEEKKEIMWKRIGEFFRKHPDIRDFLIIVLGVIIVITIIGGVIYGKR